MRSGTWNVRSLYRAGSFTAATRELARYKLDLVGVPEVSWDREVTVRTGDFFYGKENEELNDLYCSPNIVRVIKSRRMRWAGHIARLGEGRGMYRVLVGKPEGKRPLGIPRCRWEDNIKIDLQEVGCEVMDFIEAAQVRDRWRVLVNAVMNLQVP